MAAGAMALLYTDPPFVAAGLTAVAAGVALHVVQHRRGGTVSVAT